MQDFDMLRHRVEEAAQRLSLAQSERHEETQSLVGILRDLEEKYSTQEQQFSYYRDRLAPLEQSNAQLTSLIENLLDLIDRGFGEGSLDPLRKASEMASAMLTTDIKATDDTPPEHDIIQDNAAAIGATGETNSETDAQIFDAEPEMWTLDDVGEDTADNTAIAAVSEAEEDVQVIQDLVELVEEPPEIDGKEPVAIDDEDEASAVSEDAFAEEQDEAPDDGVTDLELEEVPLSYLEEDIEAASDIGGTDIDAIAAMNFDEPVAADETAPAMAAAGDDFQSSIEMKSDDGMAGDMDPGLNGQFEDVSDAVLALQLEEDASAGFDDLPDVVKSASAAFASSDTAEEVDTIATLALAMEAETSADNAALPAKSDIRSLMLRVEALAKKAEAMRLTQGEEPESAEDGENALDEQEAPATAGTDDKKSTIG